MNNMNALVIDVKGDRGFIPFKVDIPLAEETGAQKTILFKDMKAVVASLKEQGLYLIARIVVFKDDPLAAARPQWAVKSKGGGVFRDRERMRWIDPFYQEAWDYNIAIAKAAAEVGFDEVQFDYVRFPDNRKVGFAKPANQDSRTEAISGFLKAAHQALAPSNVMVAADIFGYVMWNLDDTGIGQTVASALDSVDVVCPMLYPSGYQFGIPKYKNPVQNPYEIVYFSLKRAQERTGANPLRFRPWIQAFRDYAFQGRRLQRRADADPDQGGGQVRRQRLDVLEPSQHLSHGEIRRLRRPLRTEGGMRFAFPAHGRSILTFLTYDASGISRRCSSSVS